MDTVRYSPPRAWTALLLLAVLAAPALAAPRVALVIGNASYAHVMELTNPLNDAKDIGDAFERLGFEVTRIENADKVSLWRGLQEFSLAAEAAEITVVFYAGHGIEVDQRNFLVPVDARLASDHDVEFETVPLGLVMHAAGRAKGLRMVILDACRKNPFMRSMKRAGVTRSMGQGLARVEPSGETLVAYAAKGGTVASDGTGRNSPYTEALLKYLEEPGLEVGMMFRKVRETVLILTDGRQEPFLYGSLSSREVFLSEGRTFLSPGPPPIERSDSPPKTSTPQELTVSAANASTLDDVMAVYRRGGYTTAFEGFRIHAEQGNASAQFYLGFMYDEGRGVVRNDAEAVRWYRLAAEQGEASAQTNLGLMYRKGEGVARNDAEAVRWYRLAAEQGYASAQTNLGLMYDKGRGVARNDAEAVRWYRLAAEQGYASAQFFLGNMHDEGRGVARNDTEAIRWYRLAAEQGDDAAWYFLGRMYSNGEGVARIDAETVRWYRLAAEQGNASAQFYLGIMYDEGRGVARNDAEAVRWYRLAAEQGNDDAQVHLGIMYDEGRGVTRNDAEAVRWYRLAAEQGNDDAQVHLGIMYDEGRGVARNDTEAMRWYRLAAEQGNDDAKSILRIRVR